jgi:putative transposase
MIYSVVSHVQQKAISQACRLLQVSRSGYYAAKARLLQPVIRAASVQVKAAFVVNQRCYGSRRIVDELKAQGIVMGRYKVRRLMREAGLKPVWKRKFMNTTDSKHDLPVAENLLARQFNPAQSNQAWTSDITYIRTQTGWLYLGVPCIAHGDWTTTTTGWIDSAFRPRQPVRKP